MKCPKCRLTEMIIDSVKGNIVTHYCKNCGTECMTELQTKSDAQESV